MPSRKDASAYYTETPRGIFTASGNWYLTNETELRRFAGPLLDREPIVRLLENADRWLRAAQTLTLSLFPFLLLMFPTLLAVLMSLGFFLIVKLLAPSLASFRLSGLLGFFDRVGVQFALYLVVLTWLALWPDLPAVIVGLSAFMVLRWRLLDMLLTPLIERIQARFYALPVPDQTLRTLIVRGALVLRVRLPEIEKMEQRFLRNSKRGRSR